MALSNVPNTFFVLLIWGTAVTSAVYIVFYPLKETKSLRRVSSRFGAVFVFKRWFSKTRIHFVLLLLACLHRPHKQKDRNLDLVTLDNILFLSLPLHWVVLLAPVTILSNKTNLERPLLVHNGCCIYITTFPYSSVSRYKSPLADDYFCTWLVNVWKDLYFSKIWNSGGANINW